MKHSGAGGKLIHEKNQKQKISWHCPFNQNMHKIPFTGKIIFGFSYDISTRIYFTGGHHWSLVFDTKIYIALSDYGYRIQAYNQQLRP